ncbi:F-box domain-containing protein [Seiridium cupressi]
MAQSSASSSPNPEMAGREGQREGQVRESRTGRILGQTRDLALAAPAGPVLRLPPGAIPPSSPPFHYSSPEPLSTLARQPGGREIIPTPDHIPGRPTRAQPPSPACSYTSATSRGRNPSPGTSDGSSPRSAGWELSSLDLSEEVAVIATQAQVHGEILRAGADQPVVTSPDMTRLEPADDNAVLASSAELLAVETGWKGQGTDVDGSMQSKCSCVTPYDDSYGIFCDGKPNLDRLPNEILMHILCHLEVCDLLVTSRINHHLRSLSLQPILHHYRLRHVRLSLPFLLKSPSRPSLADLVARHIFLTHTTQISRRLARSLVAIRLSRRLPLRPSAETLVQRGVLPGECVEGSVAPGLVAKKRAVERERLKDGLPLDGTISAGWPVEDASFSMRLITWDQLEGAVPAWEYHYLAPNDTNGTKNLTRDSQYMLELNSPITDYTSVLKNDSSLISWADTTLGQLASQVAGIPPNHGFSEYYYLKDIIFVALGFSPLPDSAYPQCGVIGLNGTCTRDSESPQL